MIEGIVIFVVGAGLGAGIIAAIDKKKNISGKIKNNIDQKEIEKVVNDPEKLKEALEKNGEMYDFDNDGRYQKVTYEVENDKLVERREVVDDPLKRRTPEEKEETVLEKKTKPKKKTKPAAKKAPVKKVAKSKSKRK